MITNFYVNPENVGKDSLKIVGEEARHIVTVLRHQKGETIDVVDGCGVKYKVLIQDLRKDYVEGKIFSKKRRENEPVAFLTLAQAICKGVKMDFLIEKVTEIGVSTIIPILTENTVVKIGKIVTISTPFGGSEAATYLRYMYPTYQLYKEITPSSEMIREASNIELTVPVLSIVSTGGKSKVPFLNEENDTIVTVSSQTASNHLEYYYVDLNHFEVLISDEVAKKIKSFLFS